MKMKEYTVTQYARKKRISRTAVQKKIDRKQLKARKVGNIYLITAP
jgi:hypothetical protein